MQLCICINCFLKTHNKQLNQYCLNFNIFFTKKKSFKKMVRVRVWIGSQVGSGWLAITPIESRVNPFLLWAKKNKFESGIFRVGLGWVRRLWPVLPCLLNSHDYAKWLLFIKHLSKLHWYIRIISIQSTFGETILTKFKKKI